MCVCVCVHASCVCFWTCGRARHGSFSDRPLSPSALHKLILRNFGLVGSPDDEEHMVKAERRESRTPPFRLLTVYGANGVLMMTNLLSED